MKVFNRVVGLMLMLLSLSANAALPGLGSVTTDKEQTVSPAQLDQSLKQVITVLESDKQRAQLVTSLKQLRESNAKAAPTAPGVMGLLGETLDSLEKQFQGNKSPSALWGQKFAGAAQEMRERWTSWQQLPGTLLDFSQVLLVWGAVAVALRWLARRLQQRFGLSQELPQQPSTRDLVLFALRKLGPWMIAFVITLYFSVTLNSSLGRMLALITAYVLVWGTMFAALCVISLSLLSGPHRTPALSILRRRAFHPLWLIGSLATLGGVMHDGRVMEGLGASVALCLGALANIFAAVLTGLFALRYRRPIAHLIRNQPLQRRLNGGATRELIELVGRFWYLPVLILVGISLVATVLTGGDSASTLRNALMCSAVAVMALTANGLINRAQRKPTRTGHRPSAPYVAQLRKFVFTLAHMGSLLLFVELGLRIWDMSLLTFDRSNDGDVRRMVFGFVATLLFAWLVWILADTAIQKALGLGTKNRSSTRALTMLPLIRNVIFVTIAIIAVIVALANMGMNVTPLLAGAGVIGLAIGFGAQSLVADLITGLFIIIEDSLSIDDYVDVGGHLGTVEALTIRTVRLRDLDGVVHTVPFSEIKTIKNYSRQFGYAMFRWPVPATMAINDAQALVREVAKDLRDDREVSRNIWSPLEMQGVESFDNGQAIMRFRFKTAPIKQWEVQRAFNLLLRQKLDKRGLELAMPRLNVELSRRPKVSPEANQ